MTRVHKIIFGGYWLWHVNAAFTCNHNSGLVITFRIYTSILRSC